MTIENHVVSLDLSKRLKELGVPQISFFFHETSYDVNHIRQYQEVKNNFHFHSDDYYSAYLATELGEWLPEWFDSGKISDGDFVCRFMEKHIDKNHHSFAENETDARAKMLIYLIENKIINVEDLK